MHKCLKSLLLVAAVAIAVDARQQPQFEAATVKLLPPVPPGTPLPVNLGSFRNGTAMLTNTTLSECLQFAYGIVSDAQIAGPDWIKTRDVRFEIVGKTGLDVSRDQALLMMQNLLAERLKLSLHHEPREMSFLALVVAKNGPKLAPAKAGTPPAQIPSQIPGRVLHPQMPMAILATLLSRFERKIVIDKSGLTGPSASISNGRRMPYVTVLPKMVLHLWSMDNPQMWMARHFPRHCRNNWDCAWNLERVLSTCLWSITLKRCLWIIRHEATDKNPRHGLRQSRAVR
jgi:uncharacterized protein (TIGR03435 family)